ncbi:valine dehydrogenase [Streptomyces sp. SID8366]|uniref:Leu/Phe/Val dehydrogenase n=1 Tax=unclassified Streptomyces TaxID=2593676 RepID=UPI000DBA7E5B|nr:MULTISPECIES: Glu/Leu/Phe/Val dehydrogenase dimerization domain-containing protein [Streptomyces]MYU06808.1 valine dehydrogenase [Streptomyces sp. SID8366]MYU61313.1 valine dehydrogenase [Streptomyces sp. SID69]RAJ54162.1 valine dehydrogenase (NAD) [Streptomyces sp. PsTaAH-130]TXJ82100.1 Glu/Leu/Phe/Val dehydrogenase [Streptomyces lavendulae]
MTDVSGAPADVLHTLFHSEQGGHEQVVLCQDRASGLKAVIALHSTALGPALGGTRFYPYATDAEAVADALNLARGMSYKNAMAGLDHGGGKAVIIGDPERDKTEELLLAYGRMVASLGGRYVTACDVGTYVADMDVVARECRWTTGRSPENGGAGDSSVLTAFGVYQSMRACAQHLWGDPSLRDRTVGVAGVGKVGHHLVRHLLDEGAKVVITDVRPDAVQRILDEHAGVTAVADTDALIRLDGLDIYAPCALGGALNDETVPVLTATVVCGAANNQLAHPGVEKDLADRGILYAPDYVVNAGGVIQVADELHGFDFERCRAKAARIFDTTLAIFARAKEDGIPPAAAADRIAEQRMAEARAGRGGH